MFLFFSFYLPLSCLGSSEATTTLHILGLLKEVISVLPKNNLKTVCETILKVMTLSNVVSVT